VQERADTMTWNRLAMFVERFDGSPYGLAHEAARIVRVRLTGELFVRQLLPIIIDRCLVVSRVAPHG
jgi:hypothetical protein